MDQEDSWYTLNPGMVHQDRQAVFGPKDVSPVAVHSSPGPKDAGMYTRSELSNFWDSILISAASRNALKKFSQKLIVFSNSNKNPDNFPYYAPRTDFYVDKKIDLCIRLDQSHMFLNTVESISPCFFSNS